MRVGFALFFALFLVGSVVDADLGALYRAVDAQHTRGLWAARHGNTVTLFQEDQESWVEMRDRLQVERNEFLDIVQPRGDQLLVFVLNDGALIEGQIGHGEGHLVLLGRHGDIIMTGSSLIRLSSYGVVAAAGNIEALGVLDTNRSVLVASGGVRGGSGAEVHAHTPGAIMEFNPKTGQMWVARDPEAVAREGLLAHYDEATGSGVGLAGDHSGEGGDLGADTTGAMNDPLLLGQLSSNEADQTLKRGDFYGFLHEIYNHWEQPDSGLGWLLSLKNHNGYIKVIADLDFHNALYDVMNGAKKPENKHPDDVWSIVTKGGEHVENLDGYLHNTMFHGNYVFDGGKHVLANWGCASLASCNKHTTFISFPFAVGRSAARAYAHSVTFLHPKYYTDDVGRVFNKGGKPRVGREGNLLSHFQPTFSNEEVNKAWATALSVLGGTATDIVVDEGELHLGLDGDGVGDTNSTQLFNISILPYGIPGLKRDIVVENTNFSFQSRGTVVGKTRAFRIGFLFSLMNGGFIENMSAPGGSFDVGISAPESNVSVGGVVGLIDAVPTPYQKTIEGFGPLPEGSVPVVLQHVSVGAPGNPFVFTFEGGKAPSLDSQHPAKAQRWSLGGIAGSYRTYLQPPVFSQIKVYAIINIGGTVGNVGGVVGGKLGYFRTFEAYLVPGDNNDPNYAIPELDYQYLPVYISNVGGDVTIRGSALSMGGVLGSGFGQIRGVDLAVRLNDTYGAGSHTGGVVGTVGGIWIDSPSSSERGISYKRWGYGALELAGKTSQEKVNSLFAGTGAKELLQLQDVKVRGEAKSSGGYLGGAVGGVGNADPVLQGVPSFAPQSLHLEGVGVQADLHGRDVGGLIGVVDQAKNGLDISRSYYHGKLEIEDRGAGLVGIIPEKVSYPMKLHEVFAAGELRALAGADGVYGLAWTNGGSGDISDAYVVGNIVASDEGAETAMFVGTNEKGSKVSRVYFTGRMTTTKTNVRVGVLRDNGTTTEQYFNLQVEPFLGNKIEDKIKGITTPAFASKDGPMAKWGGLWVVDGRHYPHLANISTDVQRGILSVFTTSVTSQTGGLNPESFNLSQIMEVQSMTTGTLRDRWGYYKLYYAPKTPLLSVAQMFRLTNTPPRWVLYQRGSGR